MAEAILARSGMVPQTRTINGLPLSDNVELTGENIVSDNGINVDYLNNILRYGTILNHNKLDKTILDSFEYDKSFEGFLTPEESNEAGLLTEYNFVKRYHIDGGASLILIIGMQSGIFHIRVSNDAYNDYAGGVATLVNTITLNNILSSKIVTGFYTGDGGPYKRIITRGKPKVVIVDSNGNYEKSNTEEFTYITKGIATPQSPASIQDIDFITIESNGFKALKTEVHEDAPDSNEGLHISIQLNTFGIKYTYVCFM